MHFRETWVLLAIPALLALLWAGRSKKTGAYFIFPSFSVTGKIKGTAKTAFLKWLFYMKVIAACLLIAALARPVMGGVATSKRKAIAVMIAVDTSSTMLAKDMKMGLADMAREKEPGEAGWKMDRIGGARAVIKDFISSRPDDMIGIVAFASEAYVLSPLTFDHEWLQKSVDRLKVGLIKDGTAIGSGVLSSLGALENLKAQTKIIILISDGINNFGQVPPSVAAKVARSLGVKIYTIGMVNDSGSEYPYKDKYGKTEYKKVLIPVNEKALGEMSSITGGAFFRVTDMESLRKSYAEIDKLEKTDIEESVFDRKKDAFQYLAGLALALILLEFLLSNTYFTKLP
jgi:Ca-activated chloride channel family protein